MTKIIYFNYKYNDIFKKEECEDHLNSFLDDLDILGVKYSLSKGTDFISGNIRNIHRKNKKDVEILLEKYLTGDNRVENEYFHY